jgi:hypothetical protein
LRSLLTYSPDNRKGKIGIQGITGGHLNLGTVDQPLSDTPLPVLGLAAADTFKLRTTDVALICDVFWAPAEQDTNVRMRILSLF